MPALQVSAALVAFYAALLLQFPVGDREISSIGRGICVLLGITREDTAKESEWM